MPKHVLILCANLKGNLGDFAILEAMSRRLRELYPDCPVKFYSHGDKPVDVTRFAALESEIDFEWEHLGGAPHLRRPLWLRTCAKPFRRKKFYPKLHNFAIRRAMAKLMRARAFVRTLEDAEAIFFAGGAQWGRGDLNLNMFAQLRLAKELNPAVFIFPFSVSEGAIESNGEAEFARFLSLLSEPRAVRDIVTYERLMRTGLEVELACDIVFSMADQIDSEDSSIQAHCGRVFVSPTQSGGLKVEQLSSFLGSLRALGYDPILISSCETEDREFYSRVSELSGVSSVYPETWREFVATLRTGEFAVTNRLHCMIFGTLASVPIVPVTNRTKARGFARDAKVPVTLRSFASSETENLRGIEEQLSETRTNQGKYGLACSERLAALCPRYRFPE